MPAQCVCLVSILPYFWTPERLYIEERKNSNPDSRIYNFSDAVNSGNEQKRKVVLKDKNVSLRCEVNPTCFVYVFDKLNDLEKQFKCALWRGLFMFLKYTAILEIPW